MGDERYSAISAAQTYDKIQQLDKSFQDLKRHVELTGKSLVDSMKELAHEMRLLKESSGAMEIQSRFSNATLGSIASGKNQVPLSVVLIIILVFGIALLGAAFGNRDITLGAPGGWHFESKTVAQL